MFCHSLCESFGRVESGSKSSATNGNHSKFVEGAVQCLADLTELSTIDLKLRGERYRYGILKMSPSNLYDAFELFDFLFKDLNQCFNGGNRSTVIASIAARCIAVGMTSFDD